MQNPAHKQYWKRSLLLVAAIIVGITLWFASDLTRRVRQEEREKVRIWSEAITQRSKLVAYTEKLFRDLEADERKKADRLAHAYKIINNPPEGMDLTFVGDFLLSNKTVPVLIFTDDGELVYSMNTNTTNYDSLRIAMEERFEPIRLSEVGQTIYYNESMRLRRLKEAMSELISSFVSETVLNSASVPVIMTDSTRLSVVDSRGIESNVLDDPALLAKRLESMASITDPLEVDLPGDGKRFIYFEDSFVLTQMQYYPLIQLVLIAAFLLTAYVVFSSFRRAEQDRVWVGMAKETAHQLGTPLSSLMAWVELIESGAVDPSMLVEMKKDISRLHTVTDRFSKIGSNPDLVQSDIFEALHATVSYMRPRISKKVEISLEGSSTQALFNQSLLSWVLENLLRNAVDAMEGRGEIKISLTTLEEIVQIDIADNGKGISKSDARNIFSPGFTTKKRGWGLGLSLTKRIIEEYHGGKIILLESEPGKGTTFRITLKSWAKTPIKK